MRIEQSTMGGCTVVALHGHLDLAAVPGLRRVLRKRLAEAPVAVICDLSGVDTLDPVCATIFTSVAAHWPDTRLLLCGARPTVATVLGRLRLPEFLSIHETAQAALSHAEDRPQWLREELLLASSLSAPAAARRFVRSLCESWRLGESGGTEEPGGGGPGDDLADKAVLLASELVANAVVHAGAAPGANGGLLLLVELRGRRLRLAVQDHTPRPLSLASFPVLDLEAESGRGLLLVERLATAWGAHALPGGGKVIWCVLKF